MKKQTLPLLTAALLSAHCLHAQTSQIVPEKWIDKPVITTLDNKYSKESAVVLFDKRKVEFVDEPKDEVAEYYTLHKIVHINDDRGIEYYNKIYLGITENADIVEIRGRTVLPGGKIIELDKSNIKDIKEQDGNVYKIFAMDGLEKGCEVEYYYTYKRPVSYFGREVVQGNVPELETSFQVIAPTRLRFDIKSYNFSVTPSDTVINSRRIAQCTFKATSGVDEEKYANYEAHLRRIEFKLSYNDAAHKDEHLFTWNDLAKRAFGAYTYYSDKNTKKVAELVTANGWDKLGDEPAKIKAVENYVKKNISYNEELTSDEGNELGLVIVNKVAGTIGTLRLYGAIFQTMGINFQYVLTGDRDKFIIDRSFENWNNCENTLIYFPVEGKFIAPTRPDYRYPWIVPSWGNTNGLFCKSTTLGNFSTAIAEIKNIPLEDYTKTADNIDARLELNTGLDSLTIDGRQIFTGYAATGYRDAFNYSNDEQKTTIIKELAKSFASTDHILFSEVLNPEFDKANTNEPLVLHIKTKSSELVERAGNKLLLKIGMAIGPQVEMYQEKPRQEPVDIEFGHIEERKIDFVIPEGYTISNAGDLNIDQTYKENDVLTMGFVSSYEIKGNILSVHIMEEYRKTLYPLDQFDQFRKIINASSDFNKIVLVLEKKG
jgi:hypothetical protein